MSYGRAPYYIWADGRYVTFVGEGGAILPVPYDAIGQFVARMIARGDDEVNEWIARGVALRPEDFTDDFRVTVTGGWKK